MTFIHGYLLAGLVLAGVPVLVHLIMRQKPKVLPFPAFRFLRQRALINRRKLRLQHLLLMLLRMALIAGLCLALARPRVFSSRVSLGGERPVAAVFVFDTSPSMEYDFGGRSRLDDAKQRARELLDEMAEGSQVAVFETGDEPGGDPSASEWLPSPSLIQARLDGLRVRAANGPLNRHVERACRLLQQVGEGEDAPPRFLYVFSDRTRACWDAAEARKGQVPEGVNTVFVDVGVESPKDLAIDEVKVEPAVVAPGGRVQIRVTVRGTGNDPESENELTCQLDPDEGDRLPERRAVKLERGKSRIVVFERTAPPRPAGAPDDFPCQVTVKLSATDALPFNNTRSATFVVRTGRSVLTVVSDPKAARIWKAALEVVGAFRCDVRTLDAVSRLSPKELGAYKVVCLFQVSPPDTLWKNLQGYVEGGGGLALVPGGDEMLPEVERYNKEASAHGLLPALLKGLVSVPADRRVTWSAFSSRHPLTAPFRAWSQTANPDFDRPELRPSVNRYWQVEPLGKESRTVAAYDDKGNSPTLVERPLGKGLVLQFTTPLDDRRLDGARRWHNYWEDSSFGLVLVDQVCRYLAGDSTLPPLSAFCGQAVQVPLPAPPPEPPLTLQGPGLTQAETNLKAPDAGGLLSVPQATAAGNYTVRDSKDRVVAGFSLNVRPEEGLLERVPAEEIEAALGKDSVLQAGRGVSLREAMQSVKAPPVELLPWLMMTVLLVLTVEGLLANKFYRKEPAGPAAERAPT
jgi:hypothetical protein